LEHVLVTAKVIASFRLLRDLRVLLFQGIGLLRRRLRGPSHRRRGLSTEGTEGHGNGLPASSNKAWRPAESHRPVDLPAFLPCFPFFPWSNRLPSCPAAGSRLDVRFPVLVGRGTVRVSTTKHSKHTKKSKSINSPRRRSGWDSICDCAAS
jgi:hypothetical protein